MLDDIMRMMERTIILVGMLINKESETDSHYCEIMEVYNFNVDLYNNVRKTGRISSQQIVDLDEMNDRQIRILTEMCVERGLI
jgi:hypothetical protein